MPAAKPSNNTISSGHPSVLIIAPGPFFVDRGFGVAVYEQSRALIRRGIQVEVVCYSSGRDLPDVRIHRAARFPGYGASKIGPSLARLPLWVLLLIKTILVARRTRPALLHGHLHEGGLIAGIVSRLLGIPWVLDLQGSLSLEMAEKGSLQASSLPFKAISFLERRINRLAPLILVKSRMMECDLTDRFGIDASRIYRVMDGADPSTFSPRLPDPELRHRLGIDDDATVIGYIGLLTGQQGIDRLLRAAAIVLRTHPQCHFLIMGYPDEEPRMLANELCIMPRVTFTGRLDYALAPDHLALVDLAVAPKLSETEGNAKLYNYMSMALPVVSIDNEGNREVLGADGYYVQNESPLAFAEAILKALRARDEWDARGRRLRSRIEDHLSWDAVAAKLADAYREVAPESFAIKST